MTRSERRTVWLLALSHAMVHSYMLIFPVFLLPIIKEFSVGYFMAGLMGTISGVAFGLGALPAGVFVDRIGAKRLIVIYLVGAALSSIMVGISPSFFLLTSFLGVLGLSCSLFHPSGYALISSSIKDMGRAFGYVGAGGNIGLALTPLLVGHLASYLGWRAVFVLFSIPGLVLAVLTLKLKIGSPIQPSAISHQPSATRQNADPHPGIAEGSLLTAPFFLLCLAYAFNGFTFQGAMTFLPAYLSQGVHRGLVRGDAVTAGGTLVSFALIVGILGQYIGGRLGQGPRIERSLLAMVSLGVPFLTLMGLTSGYLLLLSAFGFAFFHFANQPLLNVTIAKNTSVRFRGAGFGLAFFLAFGLGSFSAMFSGYVAELMGLSAVFFIMAVSMGLQALIILILEIQRRSDLTD